MSAGGDGAGPARPPLRHGLVMLSPGTASGPSTPPALGPHRRAESRQVPKPRQAPSRQSGGGFKRPESVLVVVYTWDGYFLMLRRSQPDTFWQSVTGSLRPGEGARSAVLRELREETGLLGAAYLQDLGQSRLFPIAPAWRARYAPGVCFNREHWFALPLPGRRLIRLNPAEHLEYSWLPAARAAAQASSWTNRDAILWLAGLSVARQRG